MEPFASFSIPKIGQMPWIALMRFLLVVLCIAPSITELNSYADLIQGSVETLWAAFDFSERRMVSGEEWEQGDLWIFEHRASHEVSIDYLSFVSANGIVDLGIISIDKIIEAPDSTEVDYWAESPQVILGHSYVLRTREGHFAKIYVREFDLLSYSLSIDWVYQDNGSKKLNNRTSDTLSIES